MARGMLLVFAVVLLAVQNSNGALWNRNGKIENSSPHIVHPSRRDTAIENVLRNVEIATQNNNEASGRTIEQVLRQLQRSSPNIIQPSTPDAAIQNVLRHVANSYPNIVHPSRRDPAIENLRRNEEISSQKNNQASGRTIEQVLRQLQLSSQKTNQASGRTIEQVLRQLQNNPPHIVHPSRPKVHDVLRKVLMSQLVDEDAEKERQRVDAYNLMQATLKSQQVDEEAEKERQRIEAYNLVQATLKAQMDAEDSRKARGDMEPVAHETAKRALKKALSDEHHLNKALRAVHHAVRQAVVSGLVVEHNPRSGSKIIHDAVSKSMNVEPQPVHEHNWNNAVDKALVNQLLRKVKPQGDQKKIHNLLRQVLTMRLEEEDVAGTSGGSIHNRAQHVMRSVPAQVHAATRSTLTQ